MQSVGSQNQLGLRERLQHEVRQEQRDEQEHDHLQGLEVRQDQRDEQQHYHLQGARGAEA